MEKHLPIQIDNPAHPGHARYQRVVNRWTVLVLYVLTACLFGTVTDFWSAAFFPIFFLLLVSGSVIILALIVRMVFLTLNAFWNFLWAVE